jgi:DNA repair protein RadC
MEISNLTMKELPESEQPYEKFLCQGPEFLSDGELLAAILRSGGKNNSALQLANSVLCRGQKSLLNLAELTVEELIKIPGIGKVKAVQLKCIAELAARMAKTQYVKRLVVENPGSIADYYMESLRHLKKEKLFLVMFDARNRLLGEALISVGTIDSALLSPREIFLTALEKQAVHVVLLHNHPSGDPSPSSEDRRATVRVAECGRMLGIYLVDHIIIGDNKYISFREQGMLN